jgi:hypothetical protein
MRAATGTMSEREEALRRKEAALSTK